MQFDVVRAWKDEAYRLSLSEAERCSLPENPVGEIELTDADLEAVYGGNKGGHNSHHCNNSNNCNNSNYGVCISNGNCQSVLCTAIFGCF